ncbi:MAG: NUDIX hydrolase [Oscillospiraceae bacterium]|nr:NUDIX hydrolase [Oscillospiraceae bacterium]
MQSNQEEKEFLKSYRLEDYPRPSVTADIAVFSLHNQEQAGYRKEPEKKLCLLLIQRGNQPFKDCWALPGGFLQPDETVEVCAGRELKEETCADVTLLRHIGIFSQPQRDPRGWIVSNAFLSVLSEEKLRNMEIQGADDASCAKWFDVGFLQNQDKYILTLRNGSVSLKTELQLKKNQFDMPEFEILENGGLAFDHAKIIASALMYLRNEAQEFRLIFDFLPEQFTLAELQKVQEAVTDKSALTANFRRKIASCVAETQEFTKGAGHRPARLYQRRK